MMMKRIVFGLLCLSLSSLFATTFQDAYFRDYGVINRLVLVFDSQPEMKEDQLQNVISLTIHEASANPDISLEIAPENKVMESFFYQVSGTTLTISIATHRMAQYRSFCMKQGDIFKVVFDLYAVFPPIVRQDAASFAYFYNTVGYPDSAAFYQAISLQLPEEVAETDSQGTFVDIQTVEVKPSGHASLLPWILAAIAVLLIAGILWRIKKKKPAAKEIAPSPLRNTDGFLPQEILELMVRDLDAHNWEPQAIADELQVSLEVIREILSN